MENKLPITRISKFFSQEDYDLQLMLSEEYMHGDLNMKLVLYRVDTTKTDTDNVYAEATTKDNIKFYPPVEFNALVRIAQPQNRSYQKGMVRYLEPGNIEIYVFIKHLEELKIDIKYGDYIGYPESDTKIRHYMVVNDGKVTSDSKHIYFGYKPYYRTITCSIVQENEFRGI